MEEFPRLWDFSGFTLVLSKKIAIVSHFNLQMFFKESCFNLCLLISFFKANGLCTTHSITGIQIPVQIPLAYFQGLCGPRALVCSNG